MTDNDSTEGGRQYFRIPVDETSKVTITLNGVSYKVINVAAGGIGIYLEDVNTFKKGAKVTDIVLTINDTSCETQGCIAHISPNDTTYLCGIQLLEMDQQTTDLLQQFIDDHQASLFSFF